MKRMKRIRAGKFVMTIIGAHITGRIPAWVNGVEVETRTPREACDVETYAHRGNLRLEWKAPGLAVVSFD
jgi:hypothetical protein